MFETSLLIIKPDYLHKRRPVLLKLLAEGFLLKGSRKLAFSPELAAEFYADYADEQGFMLEVILLSKGVSEAFIVTKENAVQTLLNTMICYFGTSADLERNIHVTKHAQSVAREINFIFPNYIHEPTDFFERQRFCNRPMLKPLIGEVYHILQNADCSQDNWKMRVADYLVRSNPKLPQVSNQCLERPDVGIQNKAQQTVLTYPSAARDAQPRDKQKSKSSSSLLSSSSPHSSMLLTSSSCVTCGGFDRSEPCPAELDLDKRVEPQSEEPACVGEEILWKEVIVYEEVVPEEEASKDEALEVEEEGEGEELASSDIESDHSTVAPPPPPKPQSESESEPEAAPEAAPVAAEEAPAPAPAAAD
ncbi:uncharacterized protein LOC108155509 [Drosophila miranda]|uniref:uncharacterized protein LOC108155509 n=1 Tax=Drosophila miranda TaxID=7229 RepID=UPI0007E7E316|nr:uncharacterized protein LOC108155509 [Drosophila miranda]